MQSLGFKRLSNFIHSSVTSSLLDQTFPPTSYFTAVLNLFKILFCVKILIVGKFTTNLKDF
jgi:hypothetical protein